MKKKILVVFLLCVPFFASGWEPDAIRMKDGVTYEGYIAEQFPDGRIVIESSAEIRTMEKTADIFVRETAGKCRIETPDGVYEDVELMEEGDWLTFRAVRAAQISARLADVEKVIFPAPDSLLCGMVLQDMIEMKDGTSYTGMIYELEPGKLMKINVNGKRIALNVNKIKAQGRRRENSDDPMWERTPYINVFYFKNGTSLEGILVRQEYESGRLNIVTRDGIEHERSAQEIVRTGKRSNPDFNPEPPVLPDGDEILVNGERMKPIKFDQKNNKVSLSRDLFVSHNVAPGKMEIVMNRISGNTPFLLPLVLPEKLKEKIDLFNLSEMVRQIDPIGSIPGPDGQVTLYYDELPSGNYIFYNPGVHTGLLLHIL